MQPFFSDPSHKPTLSPNFPISPQRPVKVKVLRAESYFLPICSTKKYLSSLGQIQRSAQVSLRQNNAWEINHAVSIWNTCTWKAAQCPGHTLGKVHFLLFCFEKKKKKQKPGNHFLPSSILGMKEVKFISKQVPGKKPIREIIPSVLFWKLSLLMYVGKNKVCLQDSAKWNPGKFSKLKEFQNRA